MQYDSKTDRHTQIMVKKNCCLIVTKAIKIPSTDSNLHNILCNKLFCSY